MFSRWVKLMFNLMAGLRSTFWLIMTLIMRESVAELVWRGIFFFYIPDSNKFELFLFHGQLLFLVGTLKGAEKVFLCFDPSISGVSGSCELWIRAVQGVVFAGIWSGRNIHKHRTEIGALLLHKIDCFLLILTQIGQIIFVYLDFQVRTNNSLLLTCYSSSSLLLFILMKFLSLSVFKVHWIIIDLRQRFQRLLDLSLGI